MRRGEAAVPGTVRRLAEDLLFDLRPFLRPAERENLPVAAPDYAGLAAQLGAALATLEAFEARHAQWDVGSGGFAWRLGPKSFQPVARLRQKVLRPPTRQTRFGDERIRERLSKLIEIRCDTAYKEGLAAGRAERNAAARGEAGAPPPSPRG